jgi:sRNA-binding protein
MKLLASAAARAAAIKSGLGAAALPPPPPRPPTKTERRREEHRKTHVVLRERWPAVFTSATPLTLGIRQDIVTALGDEVRAQAVRDFLRIWCGRKAYRKAIERGESRRRLDGSLADGSRRHE